MIIVFIKLQGKVKIGRWQWLKEKAESKEEILFVFVVLGSTFP